MINMNTERGDSIAGVFAHYRQLDFFHIGSGNSNNTSNYVVFLINVTFLRLKADKDLLVWRTNWTKTKRNLYNFVTDLKREGSSS